MKPHSCAAKCYRMTKAMSNVLRSGKKNRNVEEIRYTLGIIHICSACQYKRLRVTLSRPWVSKFSGAHF